MADSATPISLEPPISLTLSRDGPRRYNVERSCIRCHHKKIRCDKSSPCSACLKSGEAQFCRYPGLERVKRRSAKQSTTTLVQKVERLEQIVSKSVNQKAYEHRDGQSPRRSSSSSDPESGGSSNFTGLLIKDGNLVRYVNDRVLSHILEKEEEIRSAIVGPHISSNAGGPGPMARPLSLLHPISQSAFDQDIDRMLPTRRRGIQLWQTFVLNVDPIIKLLHIPTIQPTVYAAIDEASGATPDLRALLFAIYFSALTSILRDLARCSSGDNIPELEQFKRGLEICLSQGAFLDRPSMYSLQAMTIFMGAFRSFGSGRSIWTMNGTVIRAAQLMGIHKDGKLFNLSPFEQEMRRRLWWKIITCDSRSLEDQGMWVTGNRGLGDSHMPLNINDRDIDPDSTSMPAERSGFTEMTPFAAICHIQIAGEAVAQLSLCADFESYSKRLPIAQEAIAQARKILEEKFFCDYNPHIPIQKLFRDGTKMVLDKIEWRCQEGLLRFQAHTEGSKNCIENDQLFSRACVLLELSLDLISNELYANYAWHSASYLPYELLTFVLWRLHTSPTGSEAEDGWDIVSRTFYIIEESSILPDKGPRWTILCKLKEKVARLRKNSQDRTDVATLPRTVVTDKSSGELSIDRPASPMEQMWDPEDLLFSPDWATFQHSLNLDGLMWPQL